MRAYSLILLAVVLSFLRAQAQDPYFTQHPVGEEFTGSAIHALVQDQYCMLWLGTDHGLVRYDGNRWYPVEVAGVDTSIQVTALFEDADFNLWVGTKTGRVYQKSAGETLQLLDLDEGHPTHPITAITQDPRGFLWIATYGEGLYVYTGSRLFHFGIEDGLTGLDLYSMIVTPVGEVWVGTDDGINICGFDGEKKSVRSMGLQEGLPDQIVTALVSDADGNIWIGTYESGIVFYSGLTGKISPVFDFEFGDQITSMTTFVDHELWIGTQSKGVWRYTPGAPYPRRASGVMTLQQESIECLIADVEGNVWIATDKGMLMSAFRPFETAHLDVPDIQALYSDHKDQLWIGTKAGLYTLQTSPGEASVARRILPQLDFNITSILEDRFENLWIGTIDKGLYVYHPKTATVRHLGTTMQKGGYSIMSMARSAAFIWIATLEGVVSFPLHENILEVSRPPFQLLQEPWSSNLHFVFQVFVDAGDRIWFATDGNGAFSLDGQQIRQYTGQDGLEFRTVYTIIEDQFGSVWFNTPEYGLVEYDGQTYQSLGPREGLTQLNLASVQLAGNGNMLIAHTQGVELLDPDHRHFMYYDDEIGLRGWEPGLNTTAIDSRGHVYASGRNRIIKYYATDQPLSIHPRTQITSVRVYNQPVDLLTTHQFAHHQNYVSFEFVGLWYTSPNAVKYQYILEGYDLQWKESRDIVASYSNLRPGKYTFYVKASENQFFFDEPVATFAFTIRRPFWKQLWFVSLMTLFIAGAVYGLIYWREKQSRRQALFKKEMIESQLSTLKAQINPHFLFNSFNTLITIIDEQVAQPEVAIEYVEKLADFYRSILLYREKETISMEEEWKMVQNFTYLLEKRYGDNLRLHLDSPPRDKFILPMTLQMLVENAVKHNVISEQYPLDIYITVDDDRFVTVTNPLQPKLKPEVSTQFGLTSIIKRYQLLSDVQVIVEKTDSTFSVRIPILNTFVS